MNSKKLISLLLIITLATTVVLVGTSCKKKNQTTKTYYNNEETPLVFSTAEVDKVFNPFFTTSATDSNVVGMTQIGMIGNDKDGNPTYGDKEAVVVKDLQKVTTGTPDVDQTTTYYFVLKNNVKFSNGTPLTMKDVLFNLYVYLDPVYTGSSTIYSTDIVGLKEYRTQSSTETEQDSFNTRFQVAAQARIEALVDAKNDIYDDHAADGVKDTATFKKYLQDYINDYKQIYDDLKEAYDSASSTDPGYKQLENNYKNAKTTYETFQYIVKDFEKALELFKEELNDDYSNSMDSYADFKVADKTGKLYEGLFTTDVEVFLYNEGYITWNKKEAKMESSLANDYKTLRTLSKEEAINKIIADKIPGDIDEIVLYWVTSSNLMTYLQNEEMEAYFQNNQDREYKNISGIKFANMKDAVTVNGKVYQAPEYNADGSVKDGYNEILSITINGVDPKAIWNFSFAVAPMYYYSDAEHIAKFDYVENFGVEYASQTFMNNVVKDPNKLGVPVGAGPYAASKSDGGITNISEGDFYSLGVIYYERNPYYLMGPAKIKKVRYQVVASAQMLNALYNGEIDFVEPNSKPETISELDSKKSSGIENTSIRTLGYGYIGINAGKVPSLYVRQAIMHCINTQECVNYYKTTAEAIYRPMSKSSWAYPTGCTSYYPYIGSAIPEDLTVVSSVYRDYLVNVIHKTSGTLTEDEQMAYIKYLIEDLAGYTLNSSGVYQNKYGKLEYTFTIAGEETDHPAWNAMFHASEILNKCGFNITVTTDANALKKLASGALTVWAAAWGSTIDPDMYQVYHKESNATSVLNWGYKQILNDTSGKYKVEKALIDDLSTIIDDARKTDDQEERKLLYSEALDIVMQLAVELPTYQRQDLFAYNVNKMDESSLTPANELSPYKGLTSDLYNVSLNIEK